MMKIDRCGWPLHLRIFSQRLMQKNAVVAAHECIANSIVLGDVIISNLVVQYDLGRALPDRFVLKDTAHDSLGRPNKIIRKILVNLDTNIDCKHIKKQMGEFLKTLQTKSEGKAQQKCRGRHTSYKYPGPANDLLFPAWYQHRHAPGSRCRMCEEFHSNSDSACDESLTSSCKEPGCDMSRLIHREHLDSASNDHDADFDPDGVYFVIGAIGSGDSVIRSGEHRDQMAKQARVIGFEMEGAGMWDEMSCVVIKGVCDYANSYKDKEWQNYAAATAASIAKTVMERYIVISRSSDSSQSLEVGRSGDRVSQRAGGQSGGSVGGMQFNGSISGSKFVSGIHTTGGVTNISFA